MRKADREIKELSQIVDVIERADTLRLGLYGEDYPYIVPVSYCYEVEDEEVIFYIHGAQVGKKHDLIEKDNRVCIETDICHRFVEVKNDVTCEYESIIGYGHVEKIINCNEMKKALSLILKHCHLESYTYNDAVLSVLTIYKIKVNRITGKKRVV